MPRSQLDNELLVTLLQETALADRHAFEQLYQLTSPFLMGLSYRLLRDKGLAEEALRESENRFRSLFENSPVAYQALDAAGCYIDLNQRLCDLLGYQPEELMGKSFGDLWSKATRNFFPQRFEAFKNNRQVNA